MTKVSITRFTSANPLVPRPPEARGVVDAAARKAARDPKSIPLHFQVWLSFGRDREAAVEKLKRSQHWRRTLAVRGDLTEDEHVQRFGASNLLGTPDDVIEQIRALEERTHMHHLGVVMLGEDTSELLEDMHLFAREVIPAFS